MDGDFTCVLGVGMGPSIIAAAGLRCCDDGGHTFCYHSEQHTSARIVLFLVVELAVHVATEQRITDLRHQLLGNQLQSRLKSVGHLRSESIM